MDRRRLLIIVLLIILAPIMFFFLRNMGTKNVQPAQTVVQAPTEIVDRVEYTDVLVASSDISFGSRLSEGNLSWKQWPAEAAQGNFITKDNKPQALAEMTGGVVRSDIFAGEPITTRKVVMPGERSVMSALIRPGMRAAAARISVDTAAGGFIQPGDHVDIILTSSVTGLTGGGSKRYVSETIFENVRVLAIDQTFSTSEENGASVIGSTATFEMTQTDAELLSQSVAQGDISLILRPMGRAGAPGKSHSSIKKNSNEQSSLTIIRNGQPTQVAIRGQ